MSTRFALMPPIGRAGLAAIEADAGITKAALMFGGVAVVTGQAGGHADSARQQVR